MNPREFLGELKRRNVLRAAAFYCASAWLLIQVATQVFPFFHVAEWVVRWIVLAAIIGFPFGMLLSWFYEWTPKGLQLESEISPNESSSRRSGRKLDRWIVAILALAVVLLLADKFVLHQNRRVATAPATPGKSIAVLPFENLSEDKANAYFASGIQNEILTRLAAITELKVISRTSTEKFQSKPRNLKAIAAELGVNAILEGSVQKVGDEVHINTQLIDARTDTQLWAESYDRTLENVFAVEGEVAQTIADALKVKLLPGELEKINALPTKNPDAYAAFLRGEYKLHAAWASQSTTEESPLEQAEQAYAEAIAADPGFALAYAQLAYAQLTTYWFGIIDGKADPVPVLLEKAKANIDRALQLSPDLALAHAYLARWHAWGYKDDAAAGAEYQRALSIDPRQSDAVIGLASILERQGKPREAIDRLLAARTWDPRNLLLLRNLGFAYTQNRDYPEAIETFTRILALEPGDAVDASNLAEVIVLGEGDLSAAGSALDSVARKLQSDPHVVGLRFHLKILGRDFADARRLMKQTPASGFRSDWTRPLNLGIAEHGLQHKEAARQSLGQARDLLQAEVARHPDQSLNHATLGKVLAYLGEGERAVAEGKRAVELMPVARNVLDGAQWMETLAEIHAQLGDADAALPLLSQLFDLPAGDTVSSWTLKLDPVWDPVRNDPRFQKLLQLQPASEQGTAR
jgi:TolB-like protein/Tfp pilus assembly protein PilF